jgi:TIR domain
MADVFISYAREDRDHAVALASAISERGWSVWWDRKMLHGTQFRKVIGRELDAARSVIVLWSTHGVESEFVLDEASEGARRNILIPVLIDNVPLPLGFRGIHTADLTNWSPGSPAELEDVLASVAAMLGADPPKPPAPPDQRWQRLMKRHLLSLGVAAAVLIALITVVVVVNNGDVFVPSDTATTSMTTPIDTATTTVPPASATSTSPSAATSPLVYGAPFLTADRSTEAVLEIDVVEGLARPALDVSTSRGTLRLVDVLRDNGINTTVRWGTIPASAMGADGRFDDDELRAAMARHRLADTPDTWHFYVVVASAHAVNGVESLMFDDMRRGAAVFVNERDDPRPILQEMIHEIGHEMNLPHPFQAYGDTRSVMTYPVRWRNWSYDDPAVYQFDLVGQLHIRRAPEQYVRPGASRFFDYGARQAWVLSGRGD